jgi:hypothetical protein
MMKALRKPLTTFMKEAVMTSPRFSQWHTSYVHQGLRKILSSHRMAAGYIPRAVHTTRDSPGKLRHIKLSIDVGPLIGN